MTVPYIYDVYAWGVRSNGIYGDGSTSPAATAPILVASSLDIAYFDASESAGYIDSLGVLRVCGLNNYGQLGVGDFTNRTTWTVSAHPTGFKWIKVKFTDSCGMAQDINGRLWFSGRKGSALDNSGVTAGANISSWVDTGITCDSWNMSGQASAITSGISYTWGVDQVGGVSRRDPPIFGAVYTYSRSCTKKSLEPVLRAAPLGEPDLGPVGNPITQPSAMQTWHNGNAVLAEYEWVDLGGTLHYELYASGITPLSMTPGGNAVWTTTNISRTDSRLIQWLKGSTVPSVSSQGTLIFQKRGDTQLWTYGTDGEGQCGQGVAQVLTPLGVVDGGSTGWSDGCILFGNAWPSSGFGLKADGTLWGWGSDKGNAMGRAGSGVQLSVLQVGTDTNWAMIRGSARTGFAFKLISGPPDPPVPPTPVIPTGRVKCGSGKLTTTRRKCVA